MVVRSNFRAITSWVVSKRSESLTAMDQKNVVVEVTQHAIILQES